MLQQVRFIRLHFRISQSATNIRQRRQKHKQLKRKTVRNIIQHQRKPARWYKVKATKKQKHKNQYKIIIHGKLRSKQFTKKEEKVLKKLSFKGEQSKTYRVKKGTYYVKTAKSGAKMNGEYTIRCK